MSKSTQSKNSDRSAGAGPLPSWLSISRLRQWYLNYRAQRELTEHVVEKIDPQLRWVRGYRKRLRLPLQTCRDHCRKIVEGLPGPIELEPPGYDAHPLIKAAFRGAGKIEPLLRQAEFEIDNSEQQGTRRIALLSMIHSGKEMFGRKQNGAMQLGEERLVAITFADHKIVGLATSLEVSREKLEKVVFELIIEAASHELALRRDDVKELKERREKLQAMWRIFGGSSRFEEAEEPHSSKERQKLVKIHALLEETERELSESLRGTESPGDKINYVESHLSSPWTIFEAERLTFRLDWRNVVTEDPDHQASTVHLARCSLGKEFARDAVLITYDVGALDTKKASPNIG